MGRCNTPYDTVAPSEPDNIQGLGVLVFTKVAGFRHASIAAGVDAFQDLATANNWTVIHTENGAAFNDDYLAHFSVVVFLNTTWDVLSPEQELSFQQYIESGGGYLGIHAAADTEHNWGWYAELVGGLFESHAAFPNVRNADVIIEDRSHPAMAHLPRRWNRDDEWYNFDRNPRENPAIRVLASLDETSFDPGKDAMGDHPIVWQQRVGRGRAFYSGLGHTEASFYDEDYRQVLVKAVAWAANAATPPDSLISANH